jgi:hypothetical protein
MVTQDVTAGTMFSDQNVRRVSIPDTGDRIVYYHGNLVSDHRRAGHAVVSGHMVADDDLLATSMVLVPVTFKAAPPLSHGEMIDVYTQLGSKTIQVGKDLVVESSATVWVPAIDEPNWITLQANNAPLFAAASSGVGVPSTAGLGMQEAVTALAGSVSGGRIAIGGNTPSPRP